MNLDIIRKMTLLEIGELSIADRKIAIDHLQTITVRQNHPPVFGAAVEAKDLKEIERLMNENRQHKLTPATLKKYLKATEFNINDIPFIKYIMPIIESDWGLAGHIFDNVMVSMARSVNPKFSDEIYTHFPKQYTKFINSELNKDSYLRILHNEPLDNLLRHYDLTIDVNMIKNIIKSNDNHLLHYILTNDKYKSFFENQDNITQIVSQAIVNEYQNGNMLKLLVKHVNFDKNIHKYFTAEDHKQYRYFTSSSSGHLGYVLNTFDYDTKFMTTLGPYIMNAQDRGVWQVMMNSLSKQPLEMIKAFLDVVEPIKHRPFHEAFSKLKSFYELQSALPKNTNKKPGMKI